MTQKRIHRLLGALVVLTMPFIGTNLSTAEEVDPDAGGFAITVPDAALAQCMMAGDPTWVPGTPIMFEDVYHQTELVCPSLEYGTIQDLTGVEWMTNLTKLDISNSHPSHRGITSIDAVQNLWLLEHLALYNHEIEDLEPLRGLNNLSYLDLNSNNVRDLSPLAGVPNLHEIHLEHNDIWDLAPLTQLQPWRDLYVKGNHIWNTSVLENWNVSIFAAGEQSITLTVHAGGVYALVPKGYPGAEPSLVWLGEHADFNWTSGFTYTNPGISVTSFNWPEIAPDFSEMSLQITARIVHPDVPLDSGFAYDIAFLAQAGITTGYEDGRFGYGDLVQREQMAAFLYRAAGSPAVDAASCPTFTDVPASSGFATAICWLAANGITTGYEDGRFGYGDPVLREQMAAFLQRWQAPGYVSDEHCQQFPDVPAGSGFTDSICWLRESGITTGYEDGRFGHGDPVLREQMAAFIQRTLDPGPF